VSSHHYIRLKRMIHCAGCTLTPDSGGCCRAHKWRLAGRQRPCRWREQNHVAVALSGHNTHTHTYARRPALKHGAHTTTHIHKCKSQHHITHTQHAHHTHIQTCNLQASTTPVSPNRRPGRGDQSRSEPIRADQSRSAPPPKRPSAVPLSAGRCSRGGLAGGYCWQGGCKPAGPCLPL
jgi:hypothetical protein